MTKFDVARTSTVFEPRTSATATTHFARSCDGAASRAYRNGSSRRRVCRRFYVYGSVHKDKISQQSLFTLNDNTFLQYTVSLELTFTSLHALRPLVINVFVAGTAAVLVPSTTRSATTVSAGFLERAALWTRHRFCDP